MAPIFTTLPTGCLNVCTHYSLCPGLTMKTRDTFSHLGDFCRTTTIHGLLYLTPDYRNLLLKSVQSFKRETLIQVHRETDLDRGCCDRLQLGGLSDQPELRGLERKPDDDDDRHRGRDQGALPRRDGGPGRVPRQPGRGRLHQAPLRLRGV